MVRGRGAPPARDAVLVAGSINTDLVARVRLAPAAGETVTGTDFRVFGGGKGANQALATVRSGAPTAMLGALGRDDFGRQRRADLEGDGVDVAHVASATEAASGVALIVVDERGENRIAYVPGATLTVTASQAEAAVAQVRPRIILTTLELPLPTLARLVATSRQAGATVVLNATPEPALGRDLAVQADLLIVNETEAAALLGIGPDQAAAGWPETARSLAGMGPRSVVITLGAAGALVYDGGDVVRLPAPRVEVVDTTGAGDAFCGATAARLAAGAGVLDAARAGVVAGAIAVTKPGAYPSMPTLAEIDGLAAAHRA